jgi:hypothetical protein
VTKTMIRIANAGGYWGDDPYALRRQVEAGDGALSLDYVSIDFLAEITMSILQKQRAKDPTAGYARDFVTQIEPLLGTILKKGIRVITNAGGVNPRGAAAALCEVARKQGLALRVAIVEGDDVQARLTELRTTEGVEFRNMETGEDFGPVASRSMAANVYFGARPVALALKEAPDIVLCGRVTDTGITIAAMMHEFGWAETDYDKLAHGIVAGHIIECGAQATGGNFTDWPKVKSFVDVGFPIVECYADGSFVVTKHPGTGGLVSPQTVREQLLYEMGHPQSYITPDVIADFSTIELVHEAVETDTQPGRVRVSGVKGKAPTDLLKVSIAYNDGFKSTGTLILSGPDARAKAQAFSDVFWVRLESELGRMGLPVPTRTRTRTEFVGDDSTHGALSPQGDPKEILLKLSMHDDSKETLSVFRKLLPSLILSGPAGVAVTGGAPAISEVVSYWPALMPQAHAPSRVLLVTQGNTFGPGAGAGSATHSEPTTRVVVESLDWPVTQGDSSVFSPLADPFPALGLSAGVATVRVPLMAIAHARSGDKGDTSNIGLIGRSAACYVWLRENIAAKTVKSWFAHVCEGTVTRYLVPNLWSLNFLLEESLGGGGTMSLFIDAQGKTFSQALLRCEVDVPISVLESIDEASRACDGELLRGRGLERYLWRSRADTPIAPSADKAGKAGKADKGGSQKA